MEVEKERQDTLTDIELGDVLMKQEIKGIEEIKQNDSSPKESLISDSESSPSSNVVINYQELEEQVAKEKTTKSVYVFSYFVSLGGFLAGYCSVSASGSLSILEKLYHLNQFQVSFIISSYIFGGIFGALSSGFLSEKIGLRKTIFIASGIFLAQCILTTFANGYGMLIIGRLLSGIASGVASSAIPMYISEIATPEKRGQLTNVYVLFVTLSQFSAYLFTAIFANVDHQWRIIFGLAFIPSLALFISCFFLPETVRLLLRNKNSVIAFQELKKVRESESIVRKEILLVKHHMEHESNTFTFRDLFCVRPNIRALLFSMFVVSFSQFVGINAVMYFTPSILNSVGFSQKYITILSLLPSGMNFLMTIPSLIVVDKFGRRKLLLLSCSGVTIALVILVLAFRFQAAMLILFGLVFYIFNFAYGFGPLPGLISAELNSSSLANAFSATSGWISNFIVSSCFLLLIHNIPIYAVFMTFLMFSAISLVFTYFMLPETQGRTKQTITKMLDEKKLY